LSDEYLRETLALLLKEDPAYWIRFTIPDLRAMLNVSWRNTGDWHFSAKNDEADRAAQVVSVWTQVVTENVGTAVEAARQVVLIDSQLSAVSEALVQAERRQQTLLDTESSLTDWETDLMDAPSDQALSSLDHWSLLSQVAVAADFSLGWQVLLDVTPTLGSPPIDYVNWLQKVEALISAELNLLPGQIAELETQHADLSAAYKLAADQSDTLSATLEVKPIKGEIPIITQLRPVGTWILVGGMLGILILGLGWLVQITRKTK
jgi:hypothetical protein